VASLVFREVSFSYDANPHGLLENIGFGVSEGWTGVIGANGSGKTTILRLACGELGERAGVIHRPGAAVYCAQRTDEPMPQFADLLADHAADAYRLRGRLGVEDDWLDRWSTLSHGERKRAQIATALWLRPELLALDEPTNHIDREARDRLVRALRAYRGIGLLVSHDRELLDSLCSHCLFVSGSIVALRSGGYTTARSSVLEQDRVLREARVKARSDERRLERERVVRRTHQEIGEKAKSLRGVNPRDSDARQKAYAARNTDSGAGKRLRQLEGRIEHAQQAQNVGPLLRQADLGIPGAGSPAPQPTLLRLDAGSLPLGENRHLAFDEIIIQRSDRIALVGPNGSGKSTLVKHLLAHLSIPMDRRVYVPQEITAQESEAILEETKAQTGERLGRVLTWVNRLGSDPRRLLDSERPSPGEIRKLLLASHIALDPHLIVLDEPTNHMDLPSIECIEDALAEARCALLLVSHDEVFLGKLTTWRWSIEADDASGAVYRLRRQASGPPDLAGCDSAA